ncbi:cytoplasmic protein [Bacillus pseudomycoides]|uniref:DUF4241 domain-containing protein n=1 Tax=Bacillus pseudomycoides TaxID=64104 RepID=UPI000BECE68A|nr:DUF4241 domain-containing protein [Bacillus pseudomycoides]PDY46652.1 cytoplasmic protein [Bacillus pseudomycoides]PED70015.1 cytoplasmic protein [Bacillus pseudomycoides]PEI46621.1 cytoplasmic protein [Bacillus pseudomycoides]PEJ78635.1 cytoplasmic protein [Bacillus pseudomycoides]PEM10101.1 cytoplasmic protein [Bacillus pseudomycoides]
MSKLLLELSKSNSEVLRPEMLEHLKVTSGKMVACDPLIFNKNSFEQTIQPGTYPIVIWWHKEDDVIAGAELKLSESKVTGWKMATKPGQNVSELEEGYIFGYPVDTGLGCFADVEAIDKLKEIEDRLQQELGEEFISLYDDVIDDVLTEHDDEWGNCVVCEETESNIIMFRSGYGDGFYPSYWGIDENGKIVSLVTDFQVLYEK